MIFKDFIQKGSLVILSDRPYANCYIVLAIYKHHIDVGDYLTGKFIMQVCISQVYYVLVNIHGSTRKYVDLNSYYHLPKRRKGVNFKC